MQGLGKAIGITVIAISLAGCKSAVDQVRAMSAADLANAEAKASATGDVAGQICWRTLEPIISPPGAVLGAAGKIEDGRIIAQALSGPCSGILNPIIMLIRP